MANEEHVKLLKAGVEGWEVWRRANQERPNLSGAALRGAILSGAILIGADLSDADLSDANLSGANLSVADLSDAFLSGANLSGADLSTAFLSRANLFRAHLSRANFSRADLSVANLSRADLSGANFSRANLIGADLIGANLSGADLSGANFSRANLDGANFSRANLSRAILSGANLTGAVLSGAVLQTTLFAYTVVASVDLTQAASLETITHQFPSPVSTDTLRMTADSLRNDRTNQGAVETFLRGAGVDEEMIGYFRLMIGSPIEFYSCFISYTHTDKPFARRIYDALQRRGIRCWLDEKELRPGDHIHESIERGIRLWDKFIIVCSEASLGFSPWVDLETERAIQKEREAGKKKGEPARLLIPLNLDGYLLGEHCKSAKASVLKERLAADFVGWEKDNTKFESAFEDVVKALRTE